MLQVALLGGVGAITQGRACSRLLQLNIPGHPVQRVLQPACWGKRMRTSQHSAEQGCSSEIRLLTYYNDLIFP